MKLYSGSSNRKLAEKIGRDVKENVFLPEKFIFPDGEERIRILESVVEEDIVLVQSLIPPVNEMLIETAFIVDALKRSGANRVFLVTPYLGYQRQDHVFRDGEAVSLEVVIKILEGVGVDQVLVFDLHSIKIPELFHIPVVHLSALTLFANKIKSLGFDGENTVLISPDMGGIRRIRILSELLGDMPYASIEKDRDLATGGVEAKEISMSNHLHLSGKRAIIVDDMISSGGTMIKASDLLMKHGVTEIIIFVTHALFSQNAPVLLQEAPVQWVYVTDTVLIPKDKKFPKLETLSISQMIANELNKS